MLKKKTQRPQQKKEFKQEVSPILIVNKDSLEPFVELFQFEPENITQRPLGSLFGFFKVNDTNTDSAYIVNFLTSVLKKEYYSNPKRSAASSFETALHKANVALSELAKQGNMHWLGHIEAALMVIENKTLHFSVAGPAHVLLLREGSLEDASEGLASEEANDNPLKTFTDISSGKLLSKDKVIATSQELFELFHFTEIEHKALAFKRDDFQQFIHTALVNEFDLAASFIVDITEQKSITPKKEPKAIPISETDDEFRNVFSGITFEPEKETRSATGKPEESTTIEAALMDESHDDDYTDKKGHIHIKQKGYLVSSETPSPFKQRMLLLREHCMNHYDVFISKIKKERKMAQKRVSRSISNISRETFQSLKEELNKKTVQQRPEEIEREVIFEPIQKSAAPSSLRKNLIWKRVNSFFKRSTDILRSTFKKLSDTYSHKKTPSIRTQIPTRSPKNTSFKKILPSFAKMRSLIAKMDYSQRIILLVVILAIIFVPYLFQKFQNNPEDEAQNTTPSIQDIAAPSEQDTSNKNNDRAESTPIDESAIRLTHTLEKTPQNVFIAHDNVILAIDENGVTVIQEDVTKRQELPSEYGLIMNSAYMNALNLVFFTTTSLDLVSYSPISKKFTKNTITLPDTTNVTNILSMKSYDTYLYLLDENNSSIYRYARTTGGFYEMKKWLKEDISLSNFTDMAIDGNVYIASKQEFLTFFNGRKEADITLQNTDVEQTYDLITTNDVVDNIYIINKDDASLTIFNKEGFQQSKTSSDHFTTAIDIDISTNEKQLHVLLKSGELYLYDLASI